MGFKGLIKLDFWTYFLKKTKILNFMKNGPVGAELFYWDLQTDGRTDMHMTKLLAIVAFWQFFERVYKFQF